MSDKVKWRDAKDMRDRIEELEAEVELLKKKEVEEVMWRECHIEELEADLRRSALDYLAAHGQAVDAYQAQLKAKARISDLEAVLRKLEYWFDVDDDVLDTMMPDEIADNVRQLTMIRAALRQTAGEE